jgi:hypothetical protein
MSHFAAETLNRSVLEPIFEGIKPVRMGVDIVRGLTLALDKQHLVRIRRSTPIASIGRPGSEITESKHSDYFVDLATPHRRDKEGLVVVSALWSPPKSPANGEVQPNPTGNFLHYFHPKERQVFQSPDDVFEAYDLVHKNGANVTGDLTGWSNPDIHTAKGMEELAAMIGQGEIVDDDKPK